MNFIPEYILILAITILVDYFSGKYIEKTEGGKKRIYLLVSILANIGILFLFKYFNFFNDNISNIANAFGLKYSLQSLSIILPIGLSFHTFQSLSYVIEVFRGRQKAEKNILTFALYVMFYPQLVAGPIERPQNMLHQFYEKHKFDIKRFISGLELMIFGLFKKVAIADTLSLFVSNVFDSKVSHSGPSVAIATVFFAIQIYCDFSGYSDIARGSARVMGFELMQNFRQPYLSRSVSEFWKRWHISLSTWFKDYLYIPLGGNRCSLVKNIRNLIITFSISGLWHGANWTYVIWGFLNGLYLSVSVVFSSYFKNRTYNSIFKPLKIVLDTLITFGLVCVTWIFFRSENISVALSLIRDLINGWSANIFSVLLDYQVVLGQPIHLFVSSLVLILILFIVDVFQYNDMEKRLTSLFPRFSRILRLFFIANIMFLIVYFGQKAGNQFIYFQF